MTTQAQGGGQDTALSVLDDALVAMSDFHATFQPVHDDQLTPETTPAAFRRFVDALANLHYRRHRL